MDDSHACIDTIKSAFTISISKSENPEIYSKILTLFNDDMIEQGEGSWLDIQAGDYNTFMADTLNRNAKDFVCCPGKQSNILYVASYA